MKLILVNGLLGLAVLTIPAVSADAEHGESVARRWCAACHVVSAEQREASVDVPAFATIASMPNFSAERLAFFLLAPHPIMPEMALSRRDAQDLAAYIATQK